MIEKIKKILTICTICFIAIPILILICAIFGLDVFTGTTLYIILSLATLAISGVFCINALNMYNKNKTISIISISLLLISSLLAIIIYWSNFTTTLAFNNFTIILAMTTILFCIIISLHLRLGKQLLPLQITTYVIVIIIDVLITINICFFEIIAINGINQIFWTMCLVALALLCTTAILSKKSISTDSTNTKYIKITVEEYNALKSKISELEKKLNKDK
ncbi:MAG: hypothetical protein E7361_00475 [Clostridiales bacterium]|nr:hypothetical protein [Clostridiales bacterium]